MWLLERARAKPQSVATTLVSIAHSLACYLEFLDEVIGQPWDDFSSVDKYTRPTYLYKSHIEDLINAGEIAHSTGAKRMNAVIGLYRWLTDEERRFGFKPANPPWIERKVSFEIRNTQGLKQTVDVQSTDLSIKNPSREDALDTRISDGEKLRPLPQDEQRLLIAVLRQLGNREVELAHYIALDTGGRKQTVFTLRWGIFSRKPGEISQWPLKIACGPGTGIDTKGNVNANLVVHRPLYELLHVYATSPHAQIRRERSPLREAPINYLFLTSQGNPYYESKADVVSRRESSKKRTRNASKGNWINTFCQTRVLPLMRQTMPQFDYIFHDLRATFGMNWVDHQTANDPSYAAGARAREDLRKLMWHSRATTTDRYLEYRDNLRHLEAAEASWSNRLIELIRGA